jgi:hypothetical protein
MNAKIKWLVILNSITLVMMLLVNGAAGAGKYFDNSVADISYRYNTLFAPAGYAFSIWGFIFLFAIAFVGYQWFLLSTGDAGPIAQTSGWFILSNLANTAWIFCWVNDLIGLSVILILILLFSLVILTIRLKLELTDEPVRHIIFVWWPIAIYLGWVMVATIACIAAWLVSINWQAGIAIAPILTMLMIVIGTLLYLYLLATRNLRESALVGVWAFVAIAVRQWTAYPEIAWTAIACAAVLFIAISVHGYKNRQHNIGAKLVRSEWK